MFKKIKAKKILVMGLPGAGKTFLDKELHKPLKAVWINRHAIRKKYKDKFYDKYGVKLGFMSFFT